MFITGLLIALTCIAFVVTFILAYGGFALIASAFAIGNEPGYGCLGLLMILLSIPCGAATYCLMDYTHTRPHEEIVKKYGL